MLICVAKAQHSCFYIVIMNNMGGGGITRVLTSPTCRTTLGGWGFHASSPSRGPRLSVPLCLGRPGIKLCHIPVSICEFPSTCGPCLLLQNKCPSLPPRPAPPPLTSARGGGNFQVLYPTTCPCVRPREWASSRNLMWPTARLWQRKTFTVTFSFSKEASERDRGRERERERGHFCNQAFTDIPLRDCHHIVTWYPGSHSPSLCAVVPCQIFKTFIFMPPVRHCPGPGKWLLV